MLTVTVTDRAGNFVMGLPAESFTLMDGKPMSPTRVNDPDEPLSVGILVDTSGSMQEPEVQGVARPELAGPPNAPANFRNLRVRTRREY